MNLPYYWRLVCLCLATFFVANAGCWLVIRGFSPAAMRISRTMRPRLSARLLFGLRMAPVAVSLFLVIGFCVPSYVWLEPNITSERVGRACLLAATLGASVWSISLARGFAAFLRTERYMHQFGRMRSGYTDGQQGAEMLVVDDPAAVIAVAGVLHQRLIVSQAVIDSLTPEQKEVAFRHEAAHRLSRDNLKKFLFLLAPDILPFVSGASSLERGWNRITEWAADDHAVNGNQQRALSLASALVKVAKLGVTSIPSNLLSSLVDDSRDLEVRVDRLLREPMYAEKPLAPVVSFVRNAALVMAGVVFTVLLWPESLSGVHQLLERLVQ